jgi:hypothetical protein
VEIPADGFEMRTNQGGVMISSAAAFSSKTINVLKATLTFMFVLSLITAARADGPAVEITSLIGKNRLVTIVSTEGAISTQSEAAVAAQPHDAIAAQPEGVVHPNRAEVGSSQMPIRGVIVRYSDGALWGVDYAHRTVTSTNLSAYIEARQALLTRATTATPGGQSAKTTAYRTGTLRRLPDSDRIGQFRLRAFGLSENQREWRLWYGLDLPAIPTALQSEISKLIPLDSESKRALPELLGHPLLRAELRSNGSWKVLLDTTSIRNVQVKTSDFSAPAGFRPDTSSALWLDRIGNTQPVGGFQLTANALRGPGPVMSNVELYIVMWGKSFSRGQLSGGVRELFGGFNSATDPRYIKYLKQYGVDSVSIQRVFFRDSTPSSDVGNANFAAIDALVYDVGFSENAPIFWWSVGGHDPLYAVLVAQSDVEKTSWSGYHFLAFSLTHLVLPFPLSLFAHDGMPWVVAKVDDEALALPLEGLFGRPACRKPNPPAVCAAINAMDHATSSYTHEIVEAAVDPYPFFGWSDPAKQPFWSNSELADICEGNPRPWASETVVGQSMVATYWSNADNACVPESRPTLSIIEPQAGQVVPGDGRMVVLRGLAEDPVDGALSDQIMWQVDSNAVGVGGSVSAGALANGSHEIRAAVQDKIGLATDRTISISISAIAPLVTIQSPDDGSSLPIDQTIVLRGHASALPQGELPDSALAWSTAGVALGNGTQLSTHLPTLGDNVIMLTATSPAGVKASATVLVHATPQTGGISARITQPPNNSAFAARTPDGGLTDHSADITFAGQATDSSGAPAQATYQWVSDTDGFLGSGQTLIHSLRGGPCGINVHKITMTATDPSGRKATDTISVQIGQIC